jgi:hypothetical protein
MLLVLIFVRVLLQVLLRYPLYILKWAEDCLVSQKIYGRARVVQSRRCLETHCLPL